MSQEANSDPAADQPPAAEPTAEETDSAARDAAVAAAEKGIVEPAPPDPEPSEPDPEPGDKDDDAPADDDDKDKPAEGDKLPAEAAPKDDDDPPPKPSRRERREQYKAEQAKRYSRQAERRLQEAQRSEDRARTDRLIHESERRKWDQFDEEARRDPARAFARRYGTTPEEFTASNLDAQAVPPGQRTEMEELRAELREVKGGIAKREKETEERAQDANVKRAIAQDVSYLSGVADSKHADQFPFYTALPPELRQQMAHKAVLAHIKDDPPPKPLDVLDELDEWAEPIVQHIRSQNGNGRQSVESDRDQGARKPAASSRKKVPGRVSARAAAEPASRGGTMTEKQAHDAAVRRAQKAIDEGV